VHGRPYVATLESHGLTHAPCVTPLALELRCNGCNQSSQSCDALEATKALHAFSVFERAFMDYGLPRAIRTDNGVPFASRTAFFGLSKLSVRWLRLGITLERIQPGQPQQNGRHERMHLTLKKEATKPPGKNYLQQQAKFDRARVLPMSPE